MTRLADDMELAAAELEYEKAADIRDQITQLTECAGDVRT